MKGPPLPPAAVGKFTVWYRDLRQPDKWAIYTIKPTLEEAYKKTEAVHWYKEYVVLPPGEVPYKL